MRQYECPQCSAPVVFATPGAVFAVCVSCQSMVVRRDVALTSIGTMAQLPPDHTPLQVGATGDFRGRRFTLRGRLRLSWDEGSWNEWYAEFPGDAFGWVAEAQGIFVISEAVDFPAGGRDTPSGLTAGERVQMDGVGYQVIDLKEVRVIAGEGELPFVAEPGERWHSAELAGHGADFLGLEWGRGESRAYRGHYAQPEEITWHGLRPVPGWQGEPLTTERRQSEALNCPACAGVIGLNAPGQTMAIRCTHCGTIIDTSQPQPVIVQKVAKAAQQSTPVLPLGRRGTLRGVEWLVLGHLRRKDPYSTWSEYLLYNPWAGFAWLTEWNGHWNWVRRVLTPPIEGAGRALLDGVSYKAFAKEQTTITEVAGEFYWRIKVGEACAMTDYIAPPLIASKEVSAGLHEQTWSAGAYLPGSEVATAFQLPRQPPAQGPFLNAPNPHAIRWRTLRRPALLALAAAGTVQLVFGTGRCSRRDAYAQEFTYERPSAAAFTAGPANASGFASTAAPVTGTAAAPAPLITTPFELTGSQRPARIAVTAPVNNNWLGLDATLVNESTGQQFPAEVVVEFYHGDDEGGWTEGGPDQDTDVPAVPPGRYHLELEPTADASVTTMPFKVKVQRGGLFISNFIIVLLGLTAYPAWVFGRRLSFEAKRWSQSDFTP